MKRWLDTNVSCLLRLHRSCSGIGGTRIPLNNPSDYMPCACRCHILGGMK